MTVLPQRDKPTDQAIVLAAALTGREWNAADEIRGMLKRLGFDPTTQQVAAWLTRIMRLDLPPFERQDRWGQNEYRVTQWGQTWLLNTFDGLRSRRAS